MPRSKKQKARSFPDIELVALAGLGKQRLCGCDPDDTKPCTAPMIVNGDWDNPEPGDGRHADVDLAPLSSEERLLWLEHETAKRKKLELITDFHVPALDGTILALKEQNERRHSTDKAGQRHSKEVREQRKKKWQDEALEQAPASIMQHKPENAAQLAMAMCGYAGQAWDPQAAWYWNRADDPRQTSVDDPTPQKKAKDLKKSSITADTLRRFLSSQQLLKHLPS